MSVCLAFGFGFGFPIYHWTEIFKTITERKGRKQMASAGLEHRLFILRSKYGELYILIVKKARVS